MAARTGFLEHARQGAARRPVHERVRDHREVYLPLPLHTAREQASRCMGCGVAFCHHACPLGNLVPDWNDLVRRDDWRAASARLHATNNFPEFTGRLCPAPCEPACVLDIGDAPVTIKHIEQAIVDRAFAEGWIRAEPPRARSGRRVAVIGSGPAGLAAAQQLNRAGHLVTVYERADAPGGLLRYGIPDFKLEKWIVDRRIALLEAEGIAFEVNHDVGTGVDVRELRSSVDALVLAVGAEAARDVSVEGRDLGGVHLAMDYLVQQNRAVASGGAVAPAITARDKRVVIIGGGDTGADCLGGVLREGCESVQQLYLYPEAPVSRPADTPWPQWPRILRTYPAHEEGGTREFALMATAFVGQCGHVTAVRTTRVAPGDGDPRRRPRPVGGGDGEIAADLVLLAVGFDGVREQPLLHELGVMRTAVNTIAAAVDGGTEVEGVFVCGDARRGAHLIVTAIADGRAAARACDRHLSGASLLP